MPRITVYDLNVVNSAVYLVRTQLDEMSKTHGKPVTDFMSESPDQTGLFWKGEMSEVVIKHLSSMMPDLVEMWAKNPTGFMSQWFNMYRIAVTWTLMGALCRMSESAELHEMALRYEMAVQSIFTRWSDFDHLGSMDEMSVMSEPPRLVAWPM